MTDFERNLGKIERADIGFEDHGIFGVALTFNFGSLVQGMGWYSLENEVGGPMLADMMKAAGANRWDEMVGKTVWVLYDDARRGNIRGFEKLETEKRGGRFVTKEFFEKHGVFK